MPDEPQTLDNQAEVEAELARLKAGDGTAVTEAVTGEDVKPETPPTPPTPPVEPPKALTPEETQELRKRLADLERANGTAFNKLRKAERELEEIRGRPVQPPTAATPSKDPTFDDDPAAYLKHEVETSRAEIQRLNQQLTQQSQTNNIQAQETAFAKDHPDYYKAVDHLIQSETNEWEESGIAVAQGRHVMADPKFRPLLNQVSANPEVIAEAEKLGKEPEDIAAHRIARDYYIAERRQLIIQAAEATGRSVADVAYNFAKRRGYSAEQPDNSNAARERVLQAKEIAEASRSLSESSSAETSSSGPRIIRNRQQILQLPDDALDEMLQDPNQPWKQL